MIFEWMYVPIGIFLIYMIYLSLDLPKRIIRIIKIYRKGGKEEVLRRAKKGFYKISPLEMAKIELKGMAISTFGLIVGIIVFAIIRIPNIWYWVEMALFGGLFVSVAQGIGKVQNYMMYKKQEKIMEELENQNN